MDLIIEQGKNYSIYAGKNGHAGLISKDDQELLIKDLKNKSSLLIEAGVRSLIEFTKHNALCVETICWNNVYDRTFLLEDDSSEVIKRGELVSKQSISLDVVERMLAGYIMFHTRTPENPLKCWHHIYNKLDHLKDKYKNIHPQRATDNLFRQINKIDGDFKKFIQSTEIFLQYVGKLREREYWKPEIEEFVNNSEGNLAICVGKFHVPFVKDVLNKKEIEPLPSLDEYIDSINPVCKDIIYKI